MFDISNNLIVRVNRGDSFQLVFDVNIGDSLTPIKYMLTESDKLYLGVMQPHEKFENAILRKVITSQDQLESGEVVFKFDSKDTLQLSPGKYYYQVKLRTTVLDGEDIITTLSDKSLFYIQE